MKYFIKGKKSEISLTNNDHIYTGGEGQVFAKGNTAYKIYIDQKKMISLGKIQELSALSHPDIIKPEDILLDSKNIPVGYSMRYVKDTYALCQLFTKAFRIRNNISPDIMLALVRKLQNIVSHAHNNKILIVDLNELNFLSSFDFKDLFAIDVDSWQTPSFPATAIMESIRDRHSKSFNEGTDWFSFAVTAFQMFVSINPYKGGHPSIKSINERMEKNISAFNKDVTLPATCYKFDVIPEVYRKWLKIVLEDGKRLPPPNDLLATINLAIQSIQKIIGSDNFDIQDLETMPASIIDVFYSGALKVILTTDGLHINRSFIKNINPNSKIVFTPKNNSVISGTVERFLLKLYDATKQKDLPISIAATEIMESNGNLYVKSGNNILEIQLNEIGEGIIPTTKIVGQCLEKATNFFPGVVIQNLLGSYFISIFPSSGISYQVRIKELDNYKIIDAKFENKVLMIIGNKNGIYDKLIFRLDDNYSNYDFRLVKDVNVQNLNFVVLDNGVCVHLTDNEEIEIFRNDINASSIKSIKDPAISSNFHLMKNGIKLIFSCDEKLYSIMMKSKP